MGTKPVSVPEAADIRAAARHRARRRGHALERRLEARLLEDEAREVLDERLLAVVADVDDLPPRRLARGEAQDRLHGIRHVAEGAALLRPVEAEGILAPKGTQGQLGNDVIRSHARPVDIVEAAGDRAEPRARAVWITAASPRILLAA